ncbi:MAG: hypothetical protein GY757_49405, partial [bacterium]|nr:hypothetical protein [bacterium]
YLFRLYASSKTNDKSSAGMFGIGFWTIFKFNPHKIIIESSFKNEKWAVSLDDALNSSTTVCSLSKNGTRISLIRNARESSESTFVKAVESGLRHYCSHLRKNTRSAGPLPVVFAGKNINRPMSLPGPVRMGFKEGPVEGVVGLADVPHVQLYARGLPLWEGTSLEELSHTPPENSKKREFARGLAPVFIINSNNLKVNISRRQAIDNRALKKVRDSAEYALTQLVEMAADSVSPRNLFRRSKDFIKKKGLSVLQSSWKTLLVCLLLIIPLEYFIITTYFKKPPGTGAFSANDSISMLAENNRYSGASVNPISSVRRVELTYFPKNNTWFKIFHAGTYDNSIGFTRTGPDGRQLKPFPALNSTKQAVSVQLKIPSKGSFFLPVPIGHYLESGSVTLDKRPLSGARYRSSGEIEVKAPRGGIIRYRCRLPHSTGKLTPEERKFFTQLPRDLSIPAPLLQQLFDARRLNTADKAALAVRLTA